MPEHDRRTVAGDFNHVFGGVRARAGEVRDYDLIDGAALQVRELGESGGPRLPCVLAWKAEDLTGDRESIRSGDPYDAQTSAARRSGNGNDRVVQVQSRRFKSD